MLQIKILGVDKKGDDKWFKFANITPIQAQLVVVRQGYEPLLCRQYRLSQVPLKYFVNSPNR